MSTASKLAQLKEMTTEKLSHGIRSFVADQIKLESWLKEFDK